MSLIGIPASASATAAAVIPAHLVPPSASMISIEISTIDLGKDSSIKAGLRASAAILEISLDLLSGPGLLRSSTENGAILYLTLITPVLGFNKRLI